jgi:hypothetical protein
MQMVRTRAGWTCDAMLNCEGLWAIVLGHLQLPWRCATGWTTVRRTPATQDEVAPQTNGERDNPTPLGPPSEDRHDRHVCVSQTIG